MCSNLTADKMHAFTIINGVKGKYCLENNILILYNKIGVIHRRSNH